MARGGEEAGCREIIRLLGRWEVAIAHLDAGTGPAAGLSAAVRKELKDQLVAHRKKIVTTLGERFGAKPLEGASTEAGSDVDLNTSGDRAGNDLLEARAYLDRTYPGWQQDYRMGLLVDASRIQSLSEALATLDPAARAAAEARISKNTETLLAARQLRHLDGEARAAALDKIADPQVRARVESLATMDDAARRAAYDNALREGDAAMAALKSKTISPEERAKLVEQVTYQQMLANLMDEEAYVSPGGVKGYAQGKKLTNPHDRYQAALDQVGMIGHQAAAHGGVLAAMRSYEMFKYVQRLCDILEQAGIQDPGLAFFRNWADLVYRVDRAATGGPRDAIDPGSLGGKAHDPGTRVRYSDLDQPTPGPDDKFLLDNYSRFRDMAHKHLPALREQALGADAGPAPAPVELPALGPKDVPGASTSGAHGTGGDPAGAVPGQPGGPGTGPQHVTGLGDPQTMKRVAEQVDQLGRTFKSGPPDPAQIRQVVEVVLKELDAQGVPRPLVNVADLHNPGRYGEYNHFTNTLTINSGAMMNGAPAFDVGTPVGLQRVLNTAYHEARHAQQAYMAMRYRAGQLQAQMPGVAPHILAQAMANDHRVHPAIADAAVKNPMPAGDTSPEAALARDLFDEGFAIGPRRAARDWAQGVMAMSEQYHIALRDAKQRLADIGWYEFWRQADRQKLQEQIHSIMRTLNEGFVAYRALVAEIDAFSSGNRAEASLKAQMEKVRPAEEALKKARVEISAAREQLELIQRHESILSEAAAIERVLSAEQIAAEKAAELARLIEQQTGEKKTP
jgi:hypothetical protein